ncbi:MAG: hypothetical protein MUO57_19680, partial [Anaerolineales bacterium]|nr:hypothetical protein [Anaerolineales bacterium]
MSLLLVLPAHFHGALGEPDRSRNIYYQPGLVSRTRGNEFRPLIFPVWPVSTHQNSKAGSDNS